MDMEEFFEGVGFIFASYLLYRIFLKDRRPSSKETGYVGSSLPNFIGLWGCVVIFLILGILFMFGSCSSTI